MAAAVTELDLYDAGSDEKGDNLAGENGLADGENIVITRDVEADK
ncbi:cytochrome C, partial [Faecalibacterium wellingii]